jgi:polyisoprenyl-phosphate glycosyltransferase
MIKSARYSVVAPIFNEAKNLRDLYQRVQVVLDSMEVDWELILINDGSTDDSLAIMYELHLHDGRVKIVDLARNFGHQAGMSAGLDYAGGDAVILIDGDLQDPPEVLPALIEKWRQGYEVVYAIRRGRKEHVFKRMAYSAFYRLLSRIAEINIPMDAGDFSLMDRKVVDAIRSMPEKSRFLRGLRSWAGFRQVGIEYERGKRCSGVTKFTFSRLMRLAFDGFVGFSNLPLRLASFLGLAIAGASCAIGFGIILLKLFYGVKPEGWSSLAVIVLFLGGAQLITIGILGEYNARIYEEVRGRPLYILRQSVGFGEVRMECSPPAGLPFQKPADTHVAHR